MSRNPVTDWTSDWDYLDPAWVKDPYPIFDELREQCPVAHTGRYGGVYLLTRYDDIREVAYDTDRFSSRRIAVTEDVVEVETPPLTSDPPEHRPMRMMLMPPFTPQAIRKLEPLTREICSKLIDGFIDQDHFDAALDYAQSIPVPIIAEMLGISPEDGDQFREWIRMTFEDGIDDPDIIRRAAQEIDSFFLQEIAKRRAAPRDPKEDYITFLIQEPLPSGELLSDEQVANLLRIMLLAGIDTTWSAIGIAIWHLAQHPEDRQRLVDEPAMIPAAIEEFLRAYSPTIMAREIVEDTVVNGCPMRKGAMVVMPLAAANRDPRKFEDPERVILDRKNSQQAAFGMGIHRCVGAPLARMEMRIALEELLKRIPDFAIDPEKELLWSKGVVRGPRRLPLTLGQG